MWEIICQVHMADIWICRAEMDIELQKIIDEQNIP